MGSEHFTLEYAPFFRNSLFIASSGNGLKSVAIIFIVPPELHFDEFPAKVSDALSQLKHCFNLHWYVVRK